MHFAPLFCLSNETCVVVVVGSSFCALLLSGELSASVESGVCFTMPAGSWLGEMAYFEEGRRSADIVATADSLLAVVSYDGTARLAAAHAQTSLIATCVGVV
jgi:hypothetical protein